MQARFDSILSGLLERVPDSAGKPVLLAVSGGIDSMCMAELFSKSLVFQGFAVAHCNFHLRGEESDSDEELVRGWAESRGARLFHKDFDTKAYSEEKGISIEMAARELRYRWFAELAVDNGFCCVAVAHNANDNAETLILNLLRGTGIRGIAGMDEVGTVPCQGVQVPLIRPLLHFTRHQIEGFVFSHRIAYHDDRTNAETEYRRNKIRHLVFPVFGAINPSFVKTLGREMGYFSQVCDVADDYWQEHKDSILSHETSAVDGCRIDLKALMSVRHWKYMLYRALEPYGFGSSSLESLYHILTDSDTIGGKTFVSGGYELFTSTGRLEVRKRDVSLTDAAAVVPGRHIVADSLSAAEPLVIVRGPGDYFFNGTSFSVRICRRDDLDTLRQPEGIMILDADKAGFPLILRRWLPGDWFKPLGMKGRKKLSDFFTDLKYGKVEKDKAVVLVKPPAADESHGDMPEHHVAAVAGVRIDDSMKVTENTRNVMVVAKEHSDYGK